jgi:hypothetical protein
MPTGISMSRGSERTLLACPLSCSLCVLLRDAPIALLALTSETRSDRTCRRPYTLRGPSLECQRPGGHAHAPYLHSGAWSINLYVLWSSVCVLGH